MFTRKSGILALALSALVLGACDDDTTLPPAPATITIAPNPVPTLQLNAPFTLVAVTTNAPAGSTVTWASSNQAGVSVSATGVVNCLQAGATATITATISGTNPPVQSAVAISCAQDDGGVVGTPTISISRITNAAGLDVNPGNVFGVVNVVTNVDIPQGVSASAMRVLVGTTEVCRTSFASGTSADAAEAVPVTVVCSFNTAQLNAQGTPVFPNGQYQVKAEVLNPQGTAIATSTSQQLTFNNPSTLIVSVASAANALDAAGLRWEGGNLTVTVTPSIFTPNPGFNSISVTVVGDDTMGVTQTITKTVTTTGVAPVNVVFRADSTIANKGLMGIEDATVFISASGVTSAGQPFDNGGAGFPAPASIRYDAAAPRLTGVVTTPNLAQHPISGDSFFVATSTFPTNCTMVAANTYNCGTAGTSAIAGVGVTEAGVDLVKMEFQTSPSTGTATWTTRASAAEIGQQAPDALFARLRVCDALNNCKATPAGPRFGVDLVAPFINAVTNVSGVQAGPTVPVAVAAIDTGAFSAGFNTVTGYVQVQIVKDSASSTGANVSRCVSVATGTSAANTAVPAGGCAFNTVANATGNFTIDPAISGNGYYTVTIRAVDIAGNMTTTTQRFFLIDVAGASILPVVSNVSLTYTTGAATANASATIHDNVDLAEYNSRVQFSGAIVGGANTLPFTTPTTHKAFGVPVNGNAAPATNVQVIKGVWNQLTAGAALLGSISGIGFSAYDQAGNYGEGYAAFTTTASTALTSTDVVSTAVVTADDPVCKSSGCTGAPTSTTASAEIVMNVTATANPVQTVYFYYLDAAGRAVYISHTSAGNLTIPSSGPNANLRVFTYTSGTISSADLALGANTIFAVGVDADGDAALLGTYAVTVN